MLVEIRFSTDSGANAVPMIDADFPRMPVVDAGPRRDNPPARFPESEKADGGGREDVVLEFVVDRAGLPALETVQMVRGRSPAFIRAALSALPQQRFTPATIRGCAVAQVVTYPFAFVPPDSAKVLPRH